MNLPNFTETKIAVIGLGYVGLPLAVEFSEKKKCLISGDILDRNVIGFDLNEIRIKELIKGHDRNQEISATRLNKLINLKFTGKTKELINCDVFIVTVPTPINSKNEPDLSALISASAIVGKILKIRESKYDPIIVFESTVYPGATEEVCVPVIEKESGFKFNESFYCGYSPERINPGDKKYSLTKIKKVTSGSTDEVGFWIDRFYGSIINAGTHLAKNIKIAEAAKVIENTQRDLNIALINELTIIFDKLGIDTHKVLEAAGTKWNFLPFKPGLVGGHCIGVDPYYLTYKAEQIGYVPRIILSGRELNDNMSSFVSEKLIREMKLREMVLEKSKILIMGFAFKENCPDSRNTKIIDVINCLKNNNMLVDVYDPYVNEDEVLKYYNLKLTEKLKSNNYDSVLLAVSHNEFKELGIDFIKSLLKKDGVIFDLKNLFDSELSDLRL